ncbi:MAG: radical SAM protein, partial [bacterium]|nr:radical SAM protein [bacterium]
MNIDRVLLLRVSSSVDKEVDHPQFFDPPYALKYLEAGLNVYPSMQVNLLDCWIHPKDAAGMLEEAERFQPDLVVVSASSFDVEVASNLVKALKRKDSAPLVVGIGQGFYADSGIKAEQVDAYDAILLAEVEQEFFHLFDRIRNNGQSDSAWRERYHALYEKDTRFMVDEPDSLPFPSYTTEELQAYRSIYPIRLPQRVIWGFLIATRGCPHNCEFCSEVMRVSTGKQLRGRSAKNIANEMEHLEKQGVNICSFQDDSFSANRSLVVELCEELIARKSTMPWMARVRIDELDYERLVLMKQAGCVMLGIGVESGCERIIRLMNKTRK